MSDDDWKKLASAAVSLQQAALDLASLKDPIVVVKPGVKIADQDVPGGDSPASVQANLAKDPQGFRDHANSLAQDMADLARHPNMWVKLSDLPPYASANWTEEELRPYIEATLDAFGPERTIYAGDYPILLQSTSMT